MKVSFFIAAMLALGSLLPGTGKEAVAELQKFAAATRTAQGAAPDQAKFSAQMEAKAKELIGDRDVAAIPAEEAGDWAAVFETANRTADAVTLSKKALGYSAILAHNAQDRLLRSYIKNNDYQGVLTLLKRPIDVGGASELGQISETIRYSFDSIKTTKPEFLIQCYDLLLDRVHPEHAITENDKNWEPYAYASISCLKYEVWIANGKKAEALKELKTLRTRMEAFPKSVNAFGQPPTYPIDVLLKKVTLTDAQAPAITADAIHGDYKSLAAWRGQVVVVDFFAHWCGPCIRSFPELRGFQKDYGAQGLKVVGVTSYYGYFGTEKGVSKEAEQKSVTGKFIPEKQIAWPVVFDAKQTTQSAFGVEAIPHLVIIDRKGRIRHTEVGYSPAHEADLRKIIETCLSEK